MNIEKEPTAPLRVMTVFGTRPEAIKMAPLFLELERTPGVRAMCAVTAQHRGMLDEVLDTFGIRPDFDLDIMERNQSLATITVKALCGMDELLRRENPDLVLVHGDTSTTFAGALSAFYHKIRVGHVEAGLRTHDKYAPYPEELNRKMVTAIADLHFCPTELNAGNLRREGVFNGVYVTGNTVIDALRLTVKPGYVFRSEQLRRIDVSVGQLILVTAHRRENYGEGLRNIFLALRRLAERYADLSIVYPVHPSPAVREMAYAMLGKTPRIHLVDPLPVDDMHNLMASAHLVLTDSGGLQEEAPALGKPVLVLRRETERPEAVEAGTVCIAGVDADIITAKTSRLLDYPDEYACMARAVNPYGDGQACRRIVQAILHETGRAERGPIPFGSK